MFAENSRHSLAAQSVALAFCIAVGLQKDKVTSDKVVKALS
jgi:hypothetical protein